MNSKQDEYSAVVEDVKINLYLSHSTLHESEITNLAPHTHRYTELFICTHGKIKIAVNDYFFEMTENDIAIIPMGLLHQKLTSDTNSQWCSVPFSIQQYLNNGVNKIYKSIIKLCSGDKPYIFRCLPELCKTISDVKAISDKNEYSLPPLKFILVLIELVKLHNSDSISQLYSFSKNADIKRSVLLEQFIESNFMNDITADKVADKLHISTRQLCRIVMEQYGESLHKVINRKRINASAFLLRSTEYTIDKICYQVGFKSKSAFYNKFEECFGMTPLKYRNSKK